MNDRPDEDLPEQDPGWWGSWGVASIALLLTVVILLLLAAGFVWDFFWGVDTR